MYKKKITLFLESLPHHYFLIYSIHFEQNVFLLIVTNGQLVLMSLMSAESEKSVNLIIFRRFYFSGDLDLLVWVMKYSLYVNLI